MNKLVVARHGSYTKGNEEITKLADTLIELVGKESVLILSSVRVTRDARIIADKFGVPFEEHEILWSEREHPEDFPGTLKLLESRQGEADVVILVTHAEYATRFPEYYLKQELGVETDAFFLPTENGNALVVDCREKTITHIP